MLFSQKDFQWVKEIFMDNEMKRRFNLETDYGFRLVIHERDWIAGRTIRANIMDGIENSRRIIFILSKCCFAFLAHFWSTFPVTCFYRSSVI